MAAPVERRYDASRRRAAAAARRQEILEAASAQFVERGYAATTMAGIAAAAGVTAETIYTTIGTKPELFRLLTETALSGTDESVPVLDRDYIRRLAAEPDAHAKVAIYATAVARIQERMLPLYLSVGRAAAVEPALAQIWRELLDRRATNMPLLIDALAETGALRADLDRTRAAETVWAVNSTEVYHLMVSVRGWSNADYGHWLTDTLTRLLLT